MAEKQDKTQTVGTTQESQDPTVKGVTSGEDYPEGTHPARPVSEVHHSATKLEGTYSDNPDKPDPSSVAQVQEVPEDWAPVSSEVG